MLDDAEWRGWGDREIARQCYVTHLFVATLHPKAQPASGNGYQIDAPRKVKRGGTVYEMRTARLKRDYPELAAAVERGELRIRDAAREAGRPSEVDRVAAHRLDGYMILSSAQRAALAAEKVDALRGANRVHALPRRLGERGALICCHASASDFRPMGRKFPVRPRAWKYGYIMPKATE